MPHEMELASDGRWQLALSPKERKAHGQAVARHGLSQGLQVMRMEGDTALRALKAENDGWVAATKLGVGRFVAMRAVDGIIDVYDHIERRVGDNPLPVRGALRAAYEFECGAADEVGAYMRRRH